MTKWIDDGIRAWSLRMFTELYEAGHAQLDIYEAMVFAFREKIVGIPDSSHLFQLWTLDRAKEVVLIRDNGEGVIRGSIDSTKTVS